MTYDPKIPQNLLQTQKWFASIIIRPIDQESRMNPISPSGVPMEKEAPVYISPSPRLRSEERIQLYNQQYWWRLLSNLHDMLPLVTRLFGYQDFNKSIAIPYLEKYPSAHWSLNALGDRLAKWIEEDYHAPDKSLVQNAAAIDLAYNTSFFAAQYPPISLQKVNGEISGLMAETIFLQPHIFLFEMPYHLFNLRAEMLKQDPDYWIEHDFPILERGEFCFILYRNKKNLIVFDTLSKTSYKILKSFQNGCTVESICEWLEQQEEAVCLEASENLHLWLQDWILKSWLYTI